MTDLARPEGDERTEGVASLNLRLAHFREGSAEGRGERTGGAGLDLDLGHLERAEGNISEDLGGGRTGKPDSWFVLVGELLAGGIHIEILEDLVQAVFEHALERVSDERGSETFPETDGSLLLGEERDGRTQTLVFCGVDLASALV